jgi:methanogenic corrinoid protein MtbC1
MGFRTWALAALRGELPDRLPYAPRLDLWHTGRTAAGSLPPGLEDASVEEICRAEGWGVYLLTSTFVYLASSDEGMAFSALGLYAPPECGYRLSVADDVDFSWRRDGDRLHVRLETHSGAAGAVLCHTPEMLRNGITYPWVTQPFIKEFDDWRIVADLFRSLRLVPDPETYERVRRSIGEDGVVVSAAGEPGSPMHHIQKHFFPGTDFYLLYNDRRAEMEEFAAAIAPFYEQLLEFYARADVDGVTWGGNFDETITYAPFFEEQILPWLRRAAAVLRPRGIPLLTHCDGENRGLMELIRTSGIDAAESVCPYPMTALTLREYYERWAGDLCIVGGIPADYLIPEQASDADLDDYLRYLKSAVAPGRRFIAGITDAVPPTADFDRLRRVHEFFESEGRLPLATVAVPDIFVEGARPPAPSAAPAADEFTSLSAAVIAGDEAGVGDACRRLLAAGLPAQAILDEGLIHAMDVVGTRFAAGDAFIPEMLLAARAMQVGVDTLGEALTSEGRVSRSADTVILGTVRGDLHDIGKNLVALMLRGVGFDVVDLGTDVPAEEFVRALREHRASLLGLSALLTTTMPQMGLVIDALVASGERGGVRVMVGGAPVTARFARDIGADGHGSSAGDAVAVARHLAAETRQRPPA